MIFSVSGYKGSGKDLVGNIIRFLVQWERIKKDYEGDQTLYQKYINWCKVDDLEYENDWKVKKWASKLKDIVCLLIGCTRDQLESQEFKETPLGEEWNCFKIKETFEKSNILHKKVFLTAEDALNSKQFAFLILPEIIKIETTPRLLLQLIGTDCFRNIIHPNTWVNSLMNEYVPDEGYKYDVEIKNENFDGSYNLEIKSNPEVYNEGYPNWLITDTRFPNEIKAIKNNNGICIRVNRGKDIDTSNFHESETALDDFKDWDHVIDNNGTIEELINKVEIILKYEKII